MDSMEPLNFTKEGRKKMDDGKKQAKSTGYTPPTRTANANASAPVESTDAQKVSPVFPTARTKGESKNISAIATQPPVELTAKNLMAIVVMIGDFRALKALSSTSWQAVSDGKIYWCVDIPGHTFAVENGKILVDGKPLDSVLENLMVA